MKGFGAKGAWGAKGAAPYGKGAGKAGGKSKDKGPSGPELERERLTAEKFTGEVVFTRGKWGNIMPSEPVDHPDAAKKNGQLWFSFIDVLSGATELADGQQVSFHIYRDTSGTLGAEEIEEDGEPPAQAAKPRTPVAAKGGFAAKGKAAGKTAKAPWAAAAPAWGFAAPMWAADPWSKGGKGKGKDKDKGKGKGKPRSPSGADLPRERLTAEKFAGEVVEWKGKFGYIMPSEPVEHPDAQKKGGKLWVSQNDIEGGATELEAGTAVTFHIYTDSSGTLGAEEVEA